MLCSGASALEQRLVLLLPPQHENVGPQPPRQRTNPFLFFLFLSQHGIFAEKGDETKAVSWSDNFDEVVRNLDPEPAGPLKTTHYT